VGRERFLGEGRGGCTRAYLGRPHQARLRTSRAPRRAEPFLSAASPFLFLLPPRLTERFYFFGGQLTGLSSFHTVGGGQPGLEDRTLSTVCQLQPCRSYNKASEGVGGFSCRSVITHSPVII
jgi:hypothetical protein